jgi:hypothetical protein
MVDVASLEMTPEARSGEAETTGKSSRDNLATPNRAPAQPLTSIMLR